MTTITIDRATVQQALEALETYSGSLTHFNEVIDHAPAIAALRAALAQQQEQEPVARVIDDETPEGSTEWIPYSGRQVPVKTGDLLYTHPPRRETEQEPVAWMYRGIRFDDTPHDRPSLIWRPEYMDAMSANKGAKAAPLYTHPPRREWRGLTEEEISDIFEAEPRYHYPPIGATDREFARAVEAALKERNK